jgi:photosystem II stability/assembly factor-like uncharacterized protein
MKRITQIIFIVFLLSGCQIYSQTGWYEISTGVTSDFYIKKVFFVDENTGFIVCRGTTTGDSYLKRTINGGNSWDSLYLSFGPSYVNDLWFINSNTGIIVGRDDLPPQNSGVVALTTNGGLNWSLNLVQNTTSFKSIYFSNDSVGYTVGYYNNGSAEIAIIYKITSQGIMTQQFRSFVNGHTFETVNFVNSNTGIAMGDNICYKTTNSGSNWIQMPPFSTSILVNTNCLTSDMTGFLGGTTISEGVIQKTNDGGNSWQTVSLVDSSIIYGLKMVNTTTGYAVGYKNFNNGIILKTSNQGDSWNIQKLTDYNLWSVWLVNENTGYVCGQNGKLLKTTDGGGPIGMQNLNTGIPKIYQLSQNYPNPFNPITNIKFDIIKKGFVKLTVFNVLGHEVAKIVNQELQPGSYKADWDATNYPSGFYFYKIVAGDFVESKKMVLIK